MREWQPIATAPTDGSTVLLAYGALVTCGGYVDHGPLSSVGPYWWNAEGLDGLDETPTHWMPFPPPPTESHA